MRRVIVIGSPGAGKSTFSRELSRLTGLPVIHLDMIWHRPDRTTVTREEFDTRLLESVGSEKWIIDGNYRRTLEMRLDACDTVFLLDYPPEVCLDGVRSRIGKPRIDMPWIETEFDEEFRQFIKDFPKDTLPEIYAALDCRRGEKTIVVFHTRQEQNNYLRRLADEAGKQ